MAGHDINYIALSGVLCTIGSRNGPPIPPLNLVGDFGGGALYLGFGMLCALIEATRSGLGQVVDGAMVDGAAGLLTMVVGLERAGLWSRHRGDNIIDGAAPFYQTYETADGKYIAIGAIEQKFYEQLLERLNLEKDPDMRPQMERAKWRIQEKKIATEILKRTRDQWCELLEGTDACFAPVLSMREAADHPHIKARQTYIEVNGVSQPAPVPRFSRTIVPAPTPPCSPGQHSRAILSDRGFTPEEVEELCETGAVVQC
jgi:alpha-methylacyl-CoA racemase